MKDKIRQILEEATITCEDFGETTDKILRLFGVIGESEKTDTMTKDMKNKAEEKALLSAYEWGFSDELDDGRLKTLDRIGQLSRAYTLGRADAEAGDDVSSIDNQTNEEILNKIKN